MKQNSKLLLGFVGGLLLLVAGPLRPAQADWVATYLDTSTIVNVSSTPASPSLLVAAAPTSGTVYVWCHQFNTAGETIALQSTSVGFSTSTTSGNARITCTPTNALGEFFILENYRGPLYAVTCSTYAIAVNVMRKR